MAGRSPSLKQWAAGARPRTLPAAIVPVAVGVGAVLGTDTARVVWWRAIAALAVSLLLQIGVNYANDYSDGIRGTDDVRVGPLRLVAGKIAEPRAVKRAAFLCFGLAALIGLGLAVATSLWLVAIGAVAIASAWFYTGGPRPYGYAGLGEVFVFVFFGLVATVGTAFVAAESIPAVAWVAAIGVGLLISAILVVNNLRDIPTDRAAGKRTLAVRIGDAATRRLFVALLALPFAAVLVVAAFRPAALLALASGVAAVRPARIVLQGAQGRDLIPALAETGKLVLVYGALLAVGLALS